MQPDDLAARLTHAASLIDHADALLIGAGAGMSADSGIAVYRGPDGRYSSPDVLAEANADFFTTDRGAAAQTYRRRYAEVNSATPHPGYEILHQWHQRSPYGAFVYTSNIDSLFIRSGFPEHTVYEVHGALRRSQCLTRCQGPATPLFHTPDPQHAIATCPHCGEPARPNVLMFGDYAFHDAYRAQQWEHFAHWSDTIPDHARVVILEIGAGADIPTVRAKCESLSAGCNWPLVRINPHEGALPSHCAPDSTSIPLNALDALSRIAAHLRRP
jgi:NAD-dependent SIR2 family protein deacetylase